MLNAREEADVENKGQGKPQDLVAEGEGGVSGRIQATGLCFWVYRVGLSLGRDTRKGPD